MPMLNADIARQFELAADLLEIKGDNPFRIRAYRNAARIVEDLPHELAGWVADEKDLTELPGIGKDLADKISELVNTGTSVAIDTLRQSLPPHITDLLTIPGLGPKRVKKLYAELKITDLPSLKQAAEAGQIRELAGLGEKTEKQILSAIEAQTDSSRRFLRATVIPYADALQTHLQACARVHRVAIAGSYRRGRETIGDLDFLVWADDAAAVMEHFLAYEDRQDTLAHGDTKSSMRLKAGIQVDLRVVPKESFGAALHYFTGSKAHNIAMRKEAQQRKWKLNEYGLFDGENAVAGETEEAIFAALEMEWIPPELRENRGELAAAAEHSLPKLIELDDIRGNLHAHSRWSDGKNTIEEMARSAKEAGYEYLAITDHSQRLTVANGLNESRLREQLEEIDAVNQQMKGFRIFKGIEVDILADGSLDLPDSILRELDVVIVSVHSKFNLSAQEQTERIMRALDHPCTTFLAHPTGRLLLARPPYPVDVPRLIAHACERGCFLELNANPQRLDLNESYCQLAKEEGVPIVINTDAHSTHDAVHMATGIAQARRGWLTKDHVVNTRSLKAIQKMLRDTRLD